MKKLVLVISILSLLLSCSKDDSFTNETEKPVDFYACGEARLSSNPQRVSSEITRKYFFTFREFSYFEEINNNKII